MDARHDTWDGYDEDYQPAGDDHELEYWEEWEDENDEYEHQYSPVQGNWDPADFDDDDNVGGFRKSTRKLHSIKTSYENNSKEKKKRQQKIRKEAKAREKQRQKYYHYNDDDEE